MQDYRHLELLKFLKNDLDVSPASINIALKHCQNDPGPFPIVLWQYGLVTIEQLDQIYDWMEREDRATVDSNLTKLEPDHLSHHSRST